MLCSIARLQSLSLLYPIPLCFTVHVHRSLRLVYTISRSCVLLQPMSCAIYPPRGREEARNVGILAEFVLDTIPDLALAEEECSVMMK